MYRNAEQLITLDNSLNKDTGGPYMNSSEGLMDYNCCSLFDS